MPTFIKPILRVGITLLIVLAAGILISTLWQTYVRSPWTRDGRVSADVVQIAPEVSGTIAEVAVKDNQFVRRGDVLYRLDPKRFALAVQSANADLEGRRAEASVKSAIARRRTALGGDIIATETIDQANGEARIAHAAYSGSVAALDVARLNLERSVVRAPIDGYVTNLRLRPGDYAEAGNTKVAVVDSSSFWVTGYFEETKLAGIAPGMKARIRLMGFEQPIDVAARNDDRPELQYRAVFGSHCVRRIDAGNARSVRQKPHSVRPTRNADPLAYGRQKAVVSARAAFRAGMVEYRRPPSEGHNRSVLTLETAAALARTEL